MPNATINHLIVIGASNGGIEAIKEVFSALPLNLDAALLVVMHVGVHTSILPNILQQVSAIPVRHAVDGEPLVPGIALIAPPNRHLIVVDKHVRLVHGPKENFSRPAIDPLFRSAAAAYTTKVIGVVLTGDLDDGTIGLQAIKACGGRVIVQDPSSAQAPSMPLSALEYVEVDLQLDLREIGPTLGAMVAGPPVTRSRPSAIPQWIQSENVLARGEGSVDELKRIASPSTFTCPECGGSLWELHDQAPRRFRCHTGHSYTSSCLTIEQERATEAALWAAVRTLHEKEKLYLQLKEAALSKARHEAAHEYEAQAKQVREQADILRDMIVSQRNDKPTSD